MRYLFSFYFIFIFPLLLSAQSQSRLQDSLALVEIYNNTDGPNWHDNTNWLSAEPLDNWYGIIVDSNRVTEVNLHQNLLRGTIPVEIGDLTKLVQLQLHYSYLNDTIPKEIGSLTNLEALDLGGNSFTGSIPEEIGNLTKLIKLFLGGNQLTGPIPTQIGNLTKLKRLLLRSNQLSGSITSEIGNLLDLEYLFFDNNQLTGSIPSEIGNLTNLIELHIFENNLSGFIPSDIGKLVNLDELYLYKNKLTGSIPPEIGDMTLLDDLYLQENELTGALPPEIGKLTNLGELLLGNNLLTGNIPLEILDMTNLGELYINDNFFINLPDLSSMNKITGLLIQGNRFTFEDIEPNINVATREFRYAPQDSVGTPFDTLITEGSSITLSISVGGSANQYQWFFNKDSIIGAIDSTYIINSFSSSDTGSYTCEITNTIATYLTLYSKPILLSLDMTTNIDSEHPSIPREIILYSNYPNPFNPITTIKFEMPKTNRVILSLYNNLGQRVREIFNGMKEAGVHTINLNAANLPSGTYYYRIEIGGFVQTKKMVLLK